MAAALDFCVAYGDTPIVEVASNIIFGLDDKPDPLFGVVPPHSKQKIAVADNFATVSAALRATASFSVAETAYSLPKTFFLRSNYTSNRQISNRRIQLVQPIEDGLIICAKPVTQYVKAGQENNPIVKQTYITELNSENQSLHLTNFSTNFVPDGWVRLSSDFAYVWDENPEPLVEGKRNGNYILLMLGVSTGYQGVASDRTPLYDFEIHWDER